MSVPTSLSYSQSLSLNGYSELGWSSDKEINNAASSLKDQEVLWNSRVKTFAPTGLRKAAAIERDKQVMQQTIPIL